MRRFLSVLVGVFFLLGSVVLAEAYTITAQNIFDGGISGVFTSSAGGGSFALKAMPGTASGDPYNGKYVVGVTHTQGRYDVYGEIDLDGERITITFDKPFILSALDIGVLYANGNYGDNVNEKAKIVADGTAYYLTVTGGTTAEWTGSGSVSNLSPALDDYNGLWRISNPFGNTSVSKLEFYAVKQPGAGYNASNSDFGIYQIQGTVVPIPPTILLLGSGLLGFGLLSRRKKVNT